MRENGISDVKSFDDSISLDLGLCDKKGISESIRTPDSMLSMNKENGNNLRKAINKKQLSSFNSPINKNQFSKKQLSKFNSPINKEQLSSFKSPVNRDNPYDLTMCKVKTPKIPGIHKDVEIDLSINELSVSNCDSNENSTSSQYPYTARGFSIKSSNKRKRKINRTMNFNTVKRKINKISIFKDLSTEINEIYKEKLELAKLFYKNMRNEAKNFKKGIERLKKRRVVQLNISRS